MAKRVFTASYVVAQRHKDALERWAKEEGRSTSNLLRRILDAEIKRRAAAKAKTQNGFGK